MSGPNDPEEHITSAEAKQFFNEDMCLNGLAESDYLWAAKCLNKLIRKKGLSKINNPMVHEPLGQDIINLIGVDDELKNVLLDLLERTGESK